MVGTLGAASSVGGFTLTNGMPLQLVDVVSDPTGLVSFNVTGALNQAGGVITAGTLAVTGTGTFRCPRSTWSARSARQAVSAGSR